MPKINNKSVIVNKRKDGYSQLGIKPDEYLSLVESKVNFEYSQEEKKYTDNVESISYTCVEPKRYSRFSVKIESDTEPIIDNLKLQQIIESEGAPKVVLDNLTVMTYVSYDEARDVINIGDSFKADGIEFVDPK